jgi:predicted nucleic acid-binding protein
VILIDTSVWVDYFNGQETPQTSLLDDLLGNEPLAIGDLILAELLQGFRSDADFHTARELLTALTIYELLGVENAIGSAQHYRLLRARGVTVRKTTDVIIATFCIRRSYPLLFSDRDFLPFVEQLGLSDASQSL